jgi:hypothetical protein
MPHVITKPLTVNYERSRYITDNHLIFYPSFDSSLFKILSPMVMPINSRDRAIISMIYLIVVLE